jgi:hypothetical protein
LRTAIGKNFAAKCNLANDDSRQNYDVARPIGLGNLFAINPFF